MPINTQMAAQDLVRVYTYDINGKIYTVKHTEIKRKIMTVTGEALTSISKNTTTDDEQKIARAINVFKKGMGSYFARQGESPETVISTMFDGREPSFTECIALMNYMTKVIRGEIVETATGAAKTHAESAGKSGGEDIGAELDALLLEQSEP